jgi:hypothetical protein
VVFDSILGNHFLPNQSGVYIKGLSSEVKGRYKINSHGWNSYHEYTYKKPDNCFRVAVIGDSYVEALQVDVDKSFLAIIEKYLTDKNIQVYNFGHSGASLSQYLNVLRYVIKKYSPNLVVCIIQPNDFLESFSDFGRKDNLTFRIKKRWLI